MFYCSTENVLRCTLKYIHKKGIIIIIIFSIVGCKVSRLLKWLGFVVLFDSWLHCYCASEKGLIPAGQYVNRILHHQSIVIFWKFTKDFWFSTWWATQQKGRGLWRREQNRKTTETFVTITASQNPAFRFILATPTPHLIYSQLIANLSVRYTHTYTHLYSIRGRMSSIIFSYKL